MAGQKTCGCRIRKGETIGTLERGYAAGTAITMPDTIEYCPMHATAQDMLDFLLDLTRYATQPIGKYTSDYDVASSLIDRAKSLISKSGGR